VRAGRALRRCVLVASLAVALGGQSAPAGSVHRVAMKGADYDPKRVSVRVGDSIEWTNDDIVAHTATLKGAWEINVLPHRRGSVTIKTAGTFTYICRYHPNMNGEIVAEP
jgi:plastocyanin